MKVKSKKKCKQCGKTKKISEFHEHYHKCKKCHSETVQANKELSAMKAIERLLESEVIKNNEVSACRTLYISCDSRINSCRYNTGIYKDVACDWESPIKMTKDIIQRLLGMWKDWKIQNAVYEETENDSDRPTIDRVNEEGNYTIDNIQMLSKHDNTKKARAKSCRVLIIKNLKILGTFEFESITDMKNDLIANGIPLNITSFKMNNGEVQDVGNGYSLVIETNADEVKPADQPLYELIINHRREKYDLDTGEVVEVLGHWQYQFHVGAFILGDRKKKKPSKIA